MDKTTPLLPPNATRTERALAQANASIGDIPTPVRNLWNPDHCPATLLPWLAWSFGVEQWDSAWSEEQKRATIKRSLSVQRHKGTPYAVRLAIEQMGLSGRPVEWFDYGGNPFHFKISAKIPVGRAFTDADWQTLLDRIENAKNIRSRLERITLSAEASGTSHRTLCTSGIGSILAYPAQPALVSSSGVKQPAILTSARSETRLYPGYAASMTASGVKNRGACASARTDLNLYPRQPSPLTVAATRLAAQAIASTTISTLYPAPA